MKTTSKRKARRDWKRELAEAHATIAMLAQQLADKREIIRRLTT
tara:strand:+ start:334 stop:465 length:132 start_codon:yes stop_codon:yes gene_type:complete